MAKNPSPKVPKYRRQRRAHSPDDAFVEVGGQRHYLGVYGSPESKAAYRKTVAEWMVSGGHPPVPADDITVTEICARFWCHARDYYRKPDGTPTSTLHNYQSVLRPLKHLYGANHAVDFGPRSLKAVRQAMVDRGWCRRTVNQGVNLLRGVFRWAVAEQLIPVEVHSALITVAPLRQGRSEIPDREPVKPVPQAHIDAIEPHVSRQSWAIAIQLEGSIFGDPDFDQLSVRAGSNFGLPSPGETTLTQLPDNNFFVDSFFDIFFEIDFQGAPGSVLDGRAGTTQGTIRMQAGEDFPEPATSLIFGMGLIGVLARRNRTRSRTVSSERRFRRPGP